MKKQIFSVLMIMLILLSGCSFKVEKDAIYIPEGKVESIEFQKEYTEENGDSYYCVKTVTDAKDIEECCEIVRELAIEKASFDEPHPITTRPLIITFRGAKEHILVLTPDMAYYDEIAYLYQEDAVYNQMIRVYDELNYSEEKMK